MRVEVSFLGVLQNQAGFDKLTVELPEAASFRDLLDQLDGLVGDRLAAWAWDRQEKSFTPFILVLRNFVDVEEASTPLADGDEILILSPMAGG